MPAQEVIFRLRVEDSNAAVKLDLLRKELAQIYKELNLVDKGSVAFKSLFDEASKTRGEIAKLTKEQKSLNQEIKNTGVASDSLAGLRIQYSKLTEQVTKLTAAERASPAGKGLIGRANGLKKEIDGIEQSVGRFTGQVGNYKQGLAALADQFSGGLATGGIVAAVGAVVGIMKVGTEQAIKYEQGLADLSALTGQTGESLKGLENVANSLENIQVNGVDIVNLGPDILNALKLVGGARPELLKNSAALGEVTKNAIVLAKASGEELAPSVDALTTLMGQFNLQASDSARLINELAAGAKEGSSEIPQTTDAIQKFGVVAKTVNVTTGESIALVELLADRQLKGAEAGTQLRNIFTKLAGAKVLPPAAQNELSKLGIDVNVLADNSLSLEVRLKELSKASGDAGALAKIFGLENLTAATIITAGIPKYVDLKTKIEGTNEAFTQAAIRADTASNSITNLKNSALNDLEEGFSNSTGAIGIFANGLAFIIQKADLLQKALKLAIGPVSILAEQYNKFFNKTPEKNLNPGQRNDASNPFNPFDTTSQQLDANKKAVAEARLTAALAEGEALKRVAELGGEASDSIGALRQKVKTLKSEIASKPPGSTAFTALSAQLKAAKKDLESAELAAGIKKGKSSADGETEARQRQAALDSQIKRLNDIRKSIRNLDAETITNEFDKRELEIKNKGIDELEKIGERKLALEKKLREQKGGATAADKTEADLISEETASIVAATESQLAEVKKAREKANTDRITELARLSLDVQKIATENEERLAQIEVDGVNERASREKDALESAKNERVLQLTNQLNEGLITRKQFDKEVLRSERELVEKSVILEQNRSEETQKVVKELTEAKVKAARIDLESQLFTIDAALQAEKESLRARGIKEGFNPDSLIASAENLAKEKSNAATLAFKKVELDAEKQLIDTKLQGEAAVQEAKQTTADETLKQLEDEKEKRKQLKDFITEQLSTISGAVFEIEKNRIDKQQEIQTSALDAEFERRRENAQGNSVELEKIEKQYQKRKEQLEKEQAKKRKQIAIKEAIINGALAVVKALPNIFLSIAAGIAAAAQIAVISQQEFARGGSVKFGTFGGRSHSQGGTKGVFSDGTRIEVEKDEDFLILNKRASRARKHYSDLNYKHGGNKFADGGVLNFTPQLGGSSSSERIIVATEATFSDEQVNFIAAKIAEQTGGATYSATSKGLTDANRLAEREADLVKRRTV